MPIRNMNFKNELVQLLAHVLGCSELQHKSNISRTLISNKIVDYTDVVGVAPVSAAPTTFILDLTPDISGLGRGSCKTRRETFKFRDLVLLISEVWRWIRLCWFRCDTKRKEGDLRSREDTDTRFKRISYQRLRLTGGEPLHRKWRKTSFDKLCFLCRFCLFLLVFVLFIVLLWVSASIVINFSITIFITIVTFHIHGVDSF